ncbi:hypothetical protein D3C75_1263970 [compost metagenome]
MDRMVMGWMALSYSMPSTRYMVTTAASISHNVLDSDASKADAAPCSRSSTLSGMPMSCLAASMAAMASPSDPPGGRLKDRFTAGNCDR